MSPKCRLRHVREKADAAACPGSPAAEDHPSWVVSAAAGRPCLVAQPLLDVAGPETPPCVAGPGPPKPPTATPAVPPALGPPALWGLSGPGPPPVCGGPGPAEAAHGPPRRARRPGEAHAA